MFRIDQIASFSRFIRHFRTMVHHLFERSELLLITQKNRRFLVVIAGDFFEGLMAARACALSSLEAASSATKQVNHEFKSENLFTKPGKT